MTTVSVPIVAADERVGVVLTDPAPGAALESARRFALFGHVVVIGARHSADAEQTARMLRHGGGAVFGAHLDPTDLSSVNAFAAYFAVALLDRITPHRQARSFPDDFATEQSTAKPAAAIATRR